MGERWGSTPSPPLSLQAIAALATVRIAYLSSCALWSLLASADLRFPEYCRAHPEWSCTRRSRPRLHLDLYHRDLGGAAPSTAHSHAICGLVQHFRACGKLGGG